MVEHGRAMPDADAPALPLTTPSSPVRRLFLFRCVELGWSVACALAMLALPLFQVRASSFAGLDAGLELVSTVFAAVQVGLLAGLRREAGAHPAARLLRASFALALVDLAVSAVISLASLRGADAWSALGLGRALPTAFLLLLSPTFDVVFWLALERLHGRVSPALRGAFVALRLLALGMSSLFLLLPFETYRSVLLTGPFAFAYPWLRLALSVAWNGTVLVLLDRLRRSGLATPEHPELARGSDARSDLLMGALWLGGGLLVTLGTYSAAAAGGGGRYLVTTGAIAYGGVRLLRGLSRLGKS